jgi:NTP pyrophosphatase (non-canonical NTP hydrolase)
MQFNDYQQETRKTALYPHIGHNFVFPTLGLVGEAGEVAEKIKKLLRDRQIEDPTLVTPEDRQEIAKELGDVLWYMAQLATELGLELDTIAHTNLAKIKSRQERNLISGDGDNR